MHLPTVLMTHHNRNIALEHSVINNDCIWRRGREGVGEEAGVNVGT